MLHHTLLLLLLIWVNVNGKLNDCLYQHMFALISLAFVYENILLFGIGGTFHYMAINLANKFIIVEEEPCFNVYGFLINMRRI